MFVAGIDAHATYSVIAIVSNTGQLVPGPIRIKNTQEDRLDDLLGQYRSLPLGASLVPYTRRCVRVRSGMMNP